MKALVTDELQRAGILSRSPQEFLNTTPWAGAAFEPLAGDASARKYSRLRMGGQTAILMDASGNLESVAPFIRIGEHLRQLGLSAPAILARDEAGAFLLLEDFGDECFSRLVDDGGEAQ